MNCSLVHNLRSANQAEEEARYHEVVFDRPEPIARRQWEWMKELGGRGESLLDVGCGSGSFLLCAESHGLRCAGLDIGKAAIERARERLSPRARLIHGSFEDIPNEAKFDIITLWDVLDHLEAPLAALNRLREHLSPAGVLIVRVRNGPLHLRLRKIEYFISRALLKKRDRNLWAVIHRYGFSARNLLAAFAKSGLAAHLGAPSFTSGGGLPRYFSRALLDITGKRLYLAPSILAAGRVSP